MENPEDARREKLLLHLCCAPCSPYPIQTLRGDFDITLYFYNPNIQPESEYLFRLEEVKRLAEIEGLPLLVGEYRPDKWMEMASPYRDEPERGSRCELCIGERLMETARKAAEAGIRRFGAVLSVSPHKDAVMINRAGREAGEKMREKGFDTEFYEADFKKKEGFKISARISRERGFLRQNYCGCVFSGRDAEKRQMIKN